MALKTKVKRENVVSEEDGVVDWITDTGKMMKTPANQVQTTETANSPAEVVAQAGAGEEEEEEDEDEEDEEEEEEEDEDEEDEAPPPKKTAPPKAKPQKAATPPTPVAQPVTQKPQKAAAPSKPTKEKNVATAVKAKKKTVAKGVRTIGGKEVDLSNYSKVKAPGGGVSFNNGDATAKKLEGKTLDEVYRIVAKDTKQDEKELRAKYKHLNPGMQRMALGNMHRKGPRDAKKEKKAA